MKSVKMGASGNLNGTRLAVLQERKQVLEETLAKRNQELKELCIKEAELTGIIPSEIPLEPGESPPAFRRRVGTSFQLPQNLINNLNNENNSIASIEVNMKVQANMAEAALSLANDPNVSKTARRQHMQQYQFHRQQYRLLEEKLTILKNNQTELQGQQPCLQFHSPQRHKKKTRDIEQEDAISTNTNCDPFGKPMFRHSMRSLQYPVGSDSSDHKYLSGHQKLAYRSSDCDSTNSVYRQEDPLLPGIYKLSINGYKNYMERKESGNNSMPPYTHSQSNPNLHQQHSQKHYKPIQYIPTSNSTLPHNLQKHTLFIQNQPYTQNNHIQSPPYEYKKYSTIGTHCTNSYPTLLNRQSGSPYYSSSSLPKTPYATYNSNGQYVSPELGHRTVNPHQIQPHQQYESTVVNSGLGGYWRQTESGEMVWCNTLFSDNWKQEKRFGSLDRRHNKRYNKRTSPSFDSKSATISSTTFHESIKEKVDKEQHVVNRSSQDNKQLVRTLSLGSVGAQNVDSVWPSNDNLSTGGEVESVTEPISEGRKSKQKEWFETSLDGPAYHVPSRPQSSMSLALQFSAAAKSISPEEKYSEVSMQPLPFTDFSKPPLEIPAESKPNPSPIVQEPKMEFFNNNIPRNCTLIQPGGCKPYHEETKPFEMSDFYKYSTKFKQKAKQAAPKQQQQQQPEEIQNVNQQTINAENTRPILKGIYQPLQPMKCQPLNRNEDCSDKNARMDMELLGTSNCSDSTINSEVPFSSKTNASSWYNKNQEQLDDTRGNPSPGRSAATLV